MFLERLEIVGFKSFAKKTILEFVPPRSGPKGMTSIVGPNGSGKSNIAEAIRWVLGEQSMKTLRGKRSEDIIFSGSEKSGRLGMAEVSLVLNNEDRSAPVDYSEICLTRRVYRDGQGEYSINKQVVRLTDVLMLVAQCNVGQRSYSVIGQGMVDEILLATPASRIQFFEDAAGIRPQQIKLQESLRRLSRTQENLTLARAQMMEVEPRMKALRRQVEKLERHEHTLAALTQTQIHYFRVQLHMLEKEKNDLRTNLAPLALERKNAEHEHTQFQNELANLTKHNAHSRELLRLQQEYQSLIDTKQKLKEKEFELRAAEMRSAATAEERVSIRIFGGLIQDLEGWLEKVAELFTASSLPHHSLKEKLRSLHHEAVAILRTYIPYLPQTSAPKTQEEKETIRSRLQESEEKIGHISARIRSVMEVEQKEKTKLWQIQNYLKDSQKKLDALTDRLSSQKVVSARVDIRIEDTLRQIAEEVPGGIEAVRTTQLLEIQEHPEQLLARIHSLKKELELIGGIDPEVKKEYNEVRAHWELLTSHIHDLEKSFVELDRVIQELDLRMRQQFDQAFKNIAGYFETYFKQLFLGGKAQLELIKEIPLPTPEEDESVVRATSEPMPAPKRSYQYAGVEIKATPPGKKLSSLSMLSGGEKALVSIALICAIIANNPSPFVVLDEVDAALDEANSLRLAQILEDLSKKTQFMVITHNRATMERSHILYGVTMGDDGVSKVISLKLEDAADHTNR